MEYRTLGKTGLRVSAISYGGIVSAGKYGGREYIDEGQAASDRYVAWAIDRGVNYFDVAPQYGNAEEQLGQSLIPYRNHIHLACKTAKRDRRSAEEDLARSLKLLHTDHFDVYQLHGVSSMEDVERAFAPGGVMELTQEVRERGIAAHVGFTVHSERAALEMIRLWDFDSVLFPFNWHMHMDAGMGVRLMPVAKERGMGVLGMKAFVERSWDSDEERYASPFPKSWCKPIDTEDEALGVAAMKYAFTLGVDTLIPPGNFASFSFAVEHADACVGAPLSAEERLLLEEKLNAVRGKRFFQPDF